MIIEWIPTGQTSNQKYNRKLLIKLSSRVGKRILDFRKYNAPILSQHNAPVHNAFL